MKKLGIIQGRVSSPVENRIQAFPLKDWRNEFPLCKEIGISSIEWIFEYDNADENPLCSDSGIKEILELSKRDDVFVNSVLADYFMDKKLFGQDREQVNRAVDTLNFILAQCYKCGIPIIEIPLVDASALQTEKDKEEIVSNLEESLLRAQKYGITISLETSLPPSEFRELILRFNSPMVKVNYDMGNSASLGYDPKEEIDLIGEYIVNVHIKDRILGGSTVPLGDGDTDFNAVFEALKKKDYKGDFMLQGARRDLQGQEIKKNGRETVTDYRDFINPFLRNFE